TVCFSAWSSRRRRYSYHSSSVSFESRALTGHGIGNQGGRLGSFARAASSRSTARFTRSRRWSDRVRVIATPLVDRAKTISRADESAVIVPLGLGRVTSFRLPWGGQTHLVHRRP